MKAFVSLLAVFGWAFALGAANPALIPAPQKIEWTGGVADCARYQIAGPAAGDSFAAAELERILSGAGAQKNAGGTVIRLKTGPVAATGTGAYSLVAGAEGITITAPDPNGRFYGVETLRQLLAGGTSVPGCRITDWPSFAWRGFMHDVGRNYQDIALLKRFADVMAQYKLNIFHFHLTDNPGYRIECRVHPELNDPKNYQAGRYPGKFYTYAELNDFIAYCAARGITVVPEIDMPGHSAYFQRTFGVTMQSEAGTKILADCVNEFFDRVPTEYFHMGSDEVSVKNAAFMDRMADLIRQRGKKLLVWRPGHLPAGKVITQLWAKGQPLPGLPVVDSRDDYINAMDPFHAPLRELNLTTGGKTQGDELALGGTLCCWPDINVGADPLNIYRQNPVFPALLGAAERYWHGGMASRPEWWTRLPADTNDPAFTQYAEFEARMLAHRDLYFHDWPFPYVKQTEEVWKVIGPFAAGTEAPVEQGLQDSYEAQGKTFRWSETRGATVSINDFWYGASALPAAPGGGVAYALTYVRSPRDQTVGFWIGFNDPDRSSREGVPNPERGQWSNVGSRIWVNDGEIAPPDWQRPGVVKNENETPFADEGYYFRPPTPVTLKAGWNKILVKAPKTKAAFKWSFTCVPVRLEGGAVREVEGLRFAASPAGL